jgi:hypothetical protein
MDIKQAFEIEESMKVVSADQKEDEKKEKDQDITLKHDEAWQNPRNKDPQACAQACSY